MNVFISTSASTGFVVTEIPAERVEVSKELAADNRKLQNAVYSHLRAVRALGRTQVTVEEVAKNLGVPVAKASEAMAALRSRGVRLVGR